MAELVEKVIVTCVSKNDLSNIRQYNILHNKTFLMLMHNLNILIMLKYILINME